MAAESPRLPAGPLRFNFLILELRGIHQPLVDGSCGIGAAHLSPWNSKSPMATLHTTAAKIQRFNRWVGLKADTSWSGNLPEYRHGSTFSSFPYRDLRNMGRVYLNGKYVSRKIY